MCVGGCVFRPTAFFVLIFFTSLIYELLVLLYKLLPGVNLFTKTYLLCVSAEHKSRCLTGVYIKKMIGCRGCFFFSACFYQNQLINDCTGESCFLLCLIQF